MSINEKFEKAYVKHAPSWTLERDPDGRYKYPATQSAFLLFEGQEKEIEALKEFKELYRRAIVNAEKPKDIRNWVHVARLGVGAGKAKMLCTMFGVDQYGTNIHIALNEQEQSHE